MLRLLKNINTIRKHKRWRRKACSIQRDFLVSITWSAKRLLSQQRVFSVSKEISDMVRAVQCQAGKRSAQTLGSTSCPDVRNTNFSLPTWQHCFLFLEWNLTCICTQCDAGKFSSGGTDTCTSVSEEKLEFCLWIIYIHIFICLLPKGYSFLISESASYLKLHIRIKLLLNMILISNSKMYM